MKYYKKIKDNLYIIKKSIEQIFVYPKLHPEEIDYNVYWRDKRGTDLGTLSDWQVIRAQFVLDTIDKFKKSSFVDVGCGDGSILHYLMEREAVSSACGIDVSELALERAEQFGISTLRADISKVSFIKQVPPADYILLFEVLEHVIHSEVMLTEIYKKAARGVFFSFPNSGYLVHRLRFMFGKFPLQWRMFPGEHVRFWTKQDLRWWLNAMGFTKYRIHCYKGVPILNRIWPALFAAGFVVYLPKE